MLSHILYTWLVVVGLLDVVLVSPALRRAEHPQTIGRLVATLLVLVGMVLVGSGRLAVTTPLPTATAVGMFFVDVGLLGYALFLPERGIIQLVATHSRRVR